MPSKSPAQHRLMEAAAHTAGGYGGVPQAVGQEFAAADKGGKRDGHTTSGLDHALQKHADLKHPKSRGDDGTPN